MSTAQEEGLSLSDDESLLEQSSAQERVLVTQDADFLEIVPRWRRCPDLVAGTFSPLFPLRRPGRLVGCHFPTLWQ